MSIAPLQRCKRCRGDAGLASLEELGLLLGHNGPFKGGHCNARPIFSELDHAGFTHFHQDPQISLGLGAAAAVA